MKHLGIYLILYTKSRKLFVSILLIANSYHLFSQQVENRPIDDKKFFYNLTIDYHDTYVSLTRNKDSLFKIQDSSLVEFKITTPVGEQLISKYDTVGMLDNSGITFFGRDSITNAIIGFVKYRGAKKIWIQSHHLFEIWDTVNVTIDRDEYGDLPDGLRRRLELVEYVVPDLHVSGGHFWHDQVQINCEKRLTTFQLSEIRFYFLSTGKLKEEYTKEYNCECITMYTKIKARTE